MVVNFTTICISLPYKRMKPTDVLTHTGFNLFLTSINVLGACAACRKPLCALRFNIAHVAVKARKTVVTAKNATEKLRNGRKAFHNHLNW